MCVNRHALRVEINTAVKIISGREIHFRSIKNLYHRRDTLAHSNIF